MQKNKKYSEYSLRQKSNKKFITPWAYKKGVFKTNKGDFICRILRKAGNNFETISRHNTKEEAEEAYKNYYVKEKNDN